MTTPYYARDEYTYSGGDTFSISFPYLDKSHVRLVVNGDSDNYIVDFTWLTDSSIKITPSELTDINNNTISLSVGDKLSFRRVTPLANDSEYTITFTDGNILDEETQNIAHLQVLYAVQEVYDSQIALEESMTEFVSLKDRMNEILAELSDIDEKYESARSMFAETYRLLNEFNRGNVIKIPHNLFEIAMYDKTLAGTELDGLALQGSTQTRANYPDAYSALLDDFVNGTLKVYVDDDEETQYHKYTAGSTTFYIPYANTLTVGSTVYSDAACATSSGTVSSLTNVDYVKYEAGTYGNFYISQSTTFGNGIDVYSIPQLLESSKIGTITGVKLNFKSFPYQFSSTGKVYLKGDISEGATIYSDAVCETSIGTLSTFSKVYSDKYRIAGASFTNFYVPSGTSIGVGTKLYSDAGCTNQIATVSVKGTITTASAYQYKTNYAKAGNILDVTGLFPSTFYTKTKLGKSSSNVIMYVNSACTATNYKTSTNQTVSQAKILNRYSDGDASGISGQCYRATLNGINTSGTLYTYVSYVKTISASTTNQFYYQLEGSTTKCTITPEGTAEATILKVNGGANQSYSALPAENANYLKIDSGAYQPYSMVATGTASKISISNGDVAALTDEGMGVTSGVGFVYSEAENGHKIVDASLYADALEDYIEDNDGLSDFYMIDMVDEEFTLPIKSANINVYFCVANTVVAPSGMAGVTTAYLEDVLKDYIKTDGTDLSTIMQMVTDFYNMTGQINDTLSDILGEE